MNNYYTYSWTDPENGEIFYIGYGRNGRAWDLHNGLRCNLRLRYLFSKNIFFNQIVNLINTGLDKTTALKQETKLTNKYKTIEDGGTLLNEKNGLGFRKIKNHQDMVDIINLYNSGITALEIAKKYKTHETSILRWLRQENVIIRRQGYNSPFNDKDIEDIINLYKNGNTMNVIAKKYLCSATTICNILHLHNIEIRTRRLSDSRKFKNKDVIEDIINLYKTKSMIFIAKKYYCNGCVIRNILIENGIPIKNSGFKSRLPIVSNHV